MESEVDLSDFSKLTGQINFWFAVAPHDSIIFAREVRKDEIYALDYGDNP